MAIATRRISARPVRARSAVASWNRRDLDQRLARQNDGRGDHRTGKRSHADLIDASDRCDSHLLEQSLVRA